MPAPSAVPDAAAAPAGAQVPPSPPPESQSLVQRVRRVFPYISHVRRMWVVVLVATVIGAATEPAMPALMKPFLDKGFVQGSFNLWLVPAALLLLFAVRGGSGFIADVALAKIANEGMFTLRQALFGRLLDAKMDLFARESASSLSNSIVHEVQNALTLLVNALTGLVKDSLALAALLVYLIYLNWQLTLVVGIMAPAVAWLMRTASRRLYRLAKSSQAATISLSYAVEENVLANRIVRLHEAQPAQASRFRELSETLRRLAMKSAVAQALITPTMHMLAAAALSIVIMIALWQSRSDMTVGSFAAFVAAMLMLIAPVKRLSEVTSPITRALAVLERSFDLVEQVPAESGGSYAPARARGQLELRGITVQYPGAARPALHDVTLDIAPAEVVALVGPSGSGKTTLANLLPRFVEIGEGRLLLDGHDIRDWDLHALRRQFAMVSQDVVMFNDTLAANVALGQEVDEARVRHALEAANLGALVAQLPQGIATPVGHNAAMLSGGQRQRLAIARAVYKDAPLLILDEATSALDNESERLVQEALQRLMAGRTCIIIAHRLSTIEHADRVVVLDHGRVAESGPHAELIAAGGLYARLHSLQRSGVEA
ncbi:lipid A export permease/ATP-binding protein MsbA [Ramlibacter sp. USB13]|uniref:Lipid A export permease/ATP-binding protein MsbA n=1 Tax=Ramlibacter cellulosilyticus TaxID=2764187 RepID=A0A923MWC6_9BURK|nr:lipid A export permease/ATP-binding protein MsbA [Ramlibacter cellulosilyticus]MBC5785344.1 lipid A export permease/ATP-binding protein MsbA [Ramlibacter cellulosilyticus]